MSKSQQVKEVKSESDFKSFMERLCRYYMEFLETDFKRRRNPSRKIVGRTKNLLTAIPLYKYDKINRFVVDAITSNFESNKFQNIERGKFTVKVSSKFMEKVSADLDALDFENFNPEAFVQVVDKHIEKNFPDRDKSIEEIRYQSQTLIEELAEEKSAPTKSDLIELLEDFTCQDFYDELFELWKNKQILEGQELYLYFYDVTFKDNRYPLFYLPIELVKNREKKGQEIIEWFDIEFGSQVLINKAAIQFIVQNVGELVETRKAPVSVARRHLYLGDFNIPAEMQSLLNELSAYLDVEPLKVNFQQPQKSKNPHVALANNFYIAICDKSDESLLNDYEELMELLLKDGSSLLAGLFSKLANDFIFENPKVVDHELEDEYGGKEVSEKLCYRSPIPLNQEQQKILMALKDPKVKTVVIEGPPGTGKSHTITAIIFNALLEHKSILLTSDKKEALDVVEDKIASALDKIKTTDEFLQNPLLRLGKKETNYAQIFKQQNFERIRSRYFASRLHAGTLDKEVEARCSTIIDKIKSEVTAYSLLDSKSVNNFIKEEKAIQKKWGDLISFDEAFGDEDFKVFLSSAFRLVEEFQKTEVDAPEEISAPTFEALTDENLAKAGSKFQELRSFFTELNNEFLDVVRKNAKYLSNLEKAAEPFPRESFQKVMREFRALETALRDSSEIIRFIYRDPETAFENLNGFTQRANEIGGFGDLFTKISFFYAENFAKRKAALLLARDINSQKLTELKAYIEKVHRLKKFLGVILNRSELENLNRSFKNCFPSVSHEKPHRLMKHFERETRFYELLKGVQEFCQRNSDFNNNSFGYEKISALLPELMHSNLQSSLKELEEKLLEVSRAFELFRKSSILKDAPPDFLIERVSDLLSLSTVARYVEVCEGVDLACKELTRVGFHFGSGDKTLRDLLDAAKFDDFTEELLKVERFTQFFKENQADLKKLRPSVKKFGATSSKLQISPDSPLSFGVNLLRHFTESDIKELNAYLEKYQHLESSFNKLRGWHYRNDREDLEEKLTLKMTHILDEAVVKFRNENQRDQEEIKSLIKKKKKIPKELLGKLVSAFPCLLINIRDLGEYLPLEPEVFDIVVIDEASQVSIAQAFPAIIRGKKVVVLGDARQYSNVKATNASIETNNLLFNHVKKTYETYLQQFSEDKRQAHAESIGKFNIKTSILDFSRRMANYNCTLRKHFRGYPELIGYSNKTFYNNHLQVMKIRARPVETILQFHVLPVVDKQDVYANTNSYECDFIIGELEELKKRSSEQSVGVITPFTNQQKYIYGRVFSHPDNEYFLEKLKLKIMTFDSCQGDEKDIIYYSFVERDNENILRYIFPKDLQLLGDEEEGTLKAQRLNVGFSRAKEEMHFVLSKNHDGIASGEIQKALQFYRNALDQAKTLPSGKKSNEAERAVLSYITQTQFYRDHKDRIEIVEQFEIGKYLNQIYHLQLPDYRVDFLLVFKDDGNKAFNMIIEYDGFEFHFKDADFVGEANFDHFYVEQDIERQKTLEAYGYDFIRLNKFVCRNKPVEYLNDRFNEIVKKKSKIAL